MYVPKVILACSITSASNRGLYNRVFYNILDMLYNFHWVHAARNMVLYRTCYKHHGVLYNVLYYMQRVLYNINCYTTPCYIPGGGI
jgi:hypothetical protein